MAGKRRLWATAYKGFVEVVDSQDEPRVVRSVLKVPYHDWFWPHKKRTRNIPVTSFEGGDVVATYKGRKFGDLSGHTLRPGIVWLLPSEVSEKVENQMK